MSYLTRILWYLLLLLHCFRNCSELRLCMIQNMGFPSKTELAINLFDAQTRLAMIFLNMTLISVGPLLTTRLQIDCNLQKKASYSHKCWSIFYVWICLHCSKRFLRPPKHMKLYYSLFISVVFPTHHVWPKKCGSGLMAWDSVVLPSAPLLIKSAFLLNRMIDWLIYWTNFSYGAILRYVVGKIGVWYIIEQIP